MTLNNSTFKSDYYYERNLTPSSKRKLRLVKIFETAALVIFKDLKNNPWKLFFHSGPIPFGGFTMTAITSATILAGLTQNTRKLRTQLIQSKNAPIQYRLYNDFMDATYDGQVDFSMRAFFKHNVTQGKCKMMHSLYKMMNKRPEGFLKSMTQNRLKKYITKGALIFSN